MLRILFGLEGRIGRRNYWLAIIMQWVVLLGMFFAFSGAFLALAGMTGVDLTADRSSLAAADLTPEEAIFASGMGILSLVFLVLVIGLSLYMSIAAQVKRLHDMNLSGWLTLINFAAIPISMTLVASDPANAPIALFVTLIPVGLGLGCGFFPGSKGPNNYGADRISIFDLPDRSEETWEDRAKAHKMALREAQTEPASRGSDPSDDRPRRAKRTPPRSSSPKGFGKRGTA